MNNNQPEFDGAKWRCAKCKSVLATVAQVEELQLSTMEKKRIAVLELPKGYDNPQRRDEYVRPKKARPFMRGADNQKKRINARKFTERQLEVAKQKQDCASILEAQRKLAQFETLASEPSKPIGGTAPKQLHADELPVRVRCPKPGCEHVSCLTSIRALPSMAQ